MVPPMASFQSSRIGQENSSVKENCVGVLAQSLIPPINFHSQLVYNDPDSNCIFFSNFSRIIFVQRCRSGISLESWLNSFIDL